MHHRKAWRKRADHTNAAASGTLRSLGVVRVPLPAFFGWR
jgi:hypothetical protein